ncbi:MAG: nicotinate phosphoribosyltransferase, partial [Spirochaetae bacterium HGW-Spirochaetae-8]
KAIQQHAKDVMEKFHRSYKRMINPHIYKVSLSKELKTLKMRLTLEGKAKTQKVES